jgi:NADH-quinone oxidoreductase subunit F
LGKSKGMTLVHRVLSPQPMDSLELYLARGGGAGLEAALGKEPAEIIEEVLASGLRGRGGAGFPTGIKWQTVAADRSPDLATTVVVNGAEGEPGTFKDRTILRNNPYNVIEGALIAARAVGANQVVLALKQSFTKEVARVNGAIDEIRKAGWLDDVDVVVFEGPREYLYGEETALMEVIDGRMPFPRVAPPYRRGVVEVVESDRDAHTESGLSAHVEMAVPGGETGAPPTLVDNVETIANVPRIVARGAAWFRTEGTEKSPGTIVCTITGSTARAGVGEVMMGTTLREAIDEIGGGPRPGRTITAVLSGVANAFIPASALDTPLTYEDMQAVGAGLGSGGYIVFDDEDDLAAVAAGVSRFLAVESCGQCTPCKQDGLGISGLLDKICASDATARDVSLLRDRVNTVANESRCYLAAQHQVVVASLLERFPEAITAHVNGSRPATGRMLISELIEIDGDTADVDGDFPNKQPAWSYDDEDSGQVPAERFADHRARH